MKDDDDDTAFSITGGLPQQRTIQFRNKMKIMMMRRKMSAKFDTQIYLLQQRIILSTHTYIRTYMTYTQFKLLP